MTKSLPSRPDIEWLKKTAKERLSELRARDASAKLYQAQLALAREYGFQSWRALAAHVEAHSLDGIILRATIEGRAKDLAALLDEHPAKFNVTGGSYNRPPAPSRCGERAARLPARSLRPRLRCELARPARQRDGFALGGTGRAS